MDSDQLEMGIVSPYQGIISLILLLKTEKERTIDEE